MEPRSPLKKQAVPSGSADRNQSNSGRTTAMGSSEVYSLHPDVGNDQSLFQILNSSILKEVSADFEPSISELEEISKLPELRALLLAIETLSLDQGLSTEESAVRIFRVIERLRSTWLAYLVKRGTESG